MKQIVISLCVLLSFASCKQAKNATQEKEKMSEETFSSGSENEMQKIIDSILKFQPMKLNIIEERSDVDGLIPVGHNNHGTFAFIKQEDSGGAFAISFQILPAYEDFKLEARFEEGEDADSVLPKNKELIYYALKKADIKLKNSVDKISQDSLEKKYKVRFEVKKTYGAPNKEYGSDQKTLASVLINVYHGEGGLPWELANSRYTAENGIYDVGISDFLVIPGEEGVFGFIVLVTESIGFEGYRRKSFDVIQIGAVSGN